MHTTRKQKDQHTWPNKGMHYRDDFHFNSQRYSRHWVSKTWVGEKSGSGWCYSPAEPEVKFHLNDKGIYNWTAWMSTWICWQRRLYSNVSAFRHLPSGRDGNLIRVLVIEDQLERTVQMQYERWRHGETSPAEDSHFLVERTVDMKIRWSHNRGAFAHNYIIKILEERKVISTINTNIWRPLGHTINHWGTEPFFMNTLCHVGQESLPSYFKI